MGVLRSDTCVKSNHDQQLPLATAGFFWTVPLAGVFLRWPDSRGSLREPSLDRGAIHYNGGIVVVRSANQ
jgi:hypothetical protein